MARPISQAENLGCVPRGINQIKDLRYTSAATSNSGIHDRLMSIMHAEKNSSKKYVRRLVTDADNFSVVLYTDDMCDFLLKRCQISLDAPYSPIFVDTTYKLTNMWALVCTMRATDFIGHPLVVGPILLTKRQRVKDFSVLWEQLLRTEKQLKTSRLVFITDGDEALMQSIGTMFPHSQQYRCRLHLYGNIERKLFQMGIPSQNVMKDVKAAFGFQATQFQKQICDMYSRWEDLAKVHNIISSSAIKGFINYFQRVMEPVLLTNLDETLEQSGLYDVNNNPAESTNAMLKRWCKGSQSVDSVCQALGDGIQAQFIEMEKGFRGVSQKFLTEVDQTPTQTTSNLFEMLDEIDGADTDAVGDDGMTVGTADADNDGEL